ncbi:MAG TPA: glycoside hydrolase family 20 zincin-like fold domain-containing protein [Terriglobia bacterium]|nr:glycoside hydrolase family 20 zincin-like fold domain-containing protein [Terriglobia bacterium]
MAFKIDRRSFLGRTTGSLLAASMLPHPSLASGSAFAGGMPEPQIASGHPILAPEPAGIFPRPHELTESPGSFYLTEETVIILPSAASENDLRLSRFLVDELSDRYGVQPRVRQESVLPEGNRFILMGSISNPLVREYCRRRRPDVSAQNPGPEGYFLQVSDQAVVVAGCDDRGAFYGLQSLRQLIHRREGNLQIQGVQVRDWPDKPFRGIYLYVPGRGNIPFFKRFIRDFAAQYKFNTVVMEMNGCMRLDGHPELNEGWMEFARDTNYSRRNYPPGPLHGREQNSSHQDCGDGGFLEKAEVADLVEWCGRHQIEVVPAIPSLTHSFYLLTKHKELSEVPGDKWPDTYCTSNPKSYQLLFEVMDEFLEVMKPKMVHTGHDEWFAPFGLCPCCKSKVPGEVYGHDLIKVHEYLANKGIKMAIWGDYLLESVRGKGLRKHVTHDGWVYYSPGAMTPQQVKDLVPKDILLFNWFWSLRWKGKSNEALLDDFGFQQVYGNMQPDIQEYPERSKRSTIVGGAPSAWEATSEFNFGKDLVHSFLGCSNLLWSTGVLESSQISSIVQASIPGLRRNLSGETAPSETGDPVVPVDISASFNMPLRQSAFAVDLGSMQTGKVTLGSRAFDLPSAGAASGKGVVMVGTEGQTPNPLPREVRGIRIGEDATSLIFLHACARPATNKEAYRLIWDMKDSADLLGWYEVVYEDGLPELIPIRYGVHLLEWNWRCHPARGAYCYGADEVACGQNKENPISFFAFEWTSPRLGQVIREVNLKGSEHFRGAVPGFENSFGKVIPNNAVLLKAISFVKRRG